MCHGETLPLCRLCPAIIVTWELGREERNCQTTNHNEDKGKKTEKKGM